MAQENETAEEAEKRSCLSGTRQLGEDDALEAEVRKLFGEETTVMMNDIGQIR